MRRVLATAFLSLTLTLAAPAPVLSPYVTHESRPLSQSWTPRHRAPADTVLPLRIALRPSPLPISLDALLHAVSDPASPQYGAHWSRARVRETFRPDRDAVGTVGAWLARGGVDRTRVRVNADGGWMEAQVTVEEAERLLMTEYHIYDFVREGGDRVTTVACGEEYSLPEDVSAYVDFVLPTLHFGVVPRKNVARTKAIGQPGSGSSFPKAVGVFKGLSTDLDHCDGQITPDCLRALYNFHYTPVATHKNSIGIVEYTPQSYLSADMDMFFRNYSSTQVSQRPKLISIDGGELQNLEGAVYNAEPDLDLQYAMTLVGKEQQVTLYQVGDVIAGASFNTFLDALDVSYCTYEGGDDPAEDPTYPDIMGGYDKHDCGTTNATYVISTSYSMDEADLTPAYMQRQCNEYAKLGLMGITVLYSSGDYGVAGYGNVCLDVPGTTGGFSPSFPGTCPYVTSVGATQINPGAKVTDPESACSRDIYSGGGFSNVFTVPSYQEAAVQSYLQNYPPPFSSAIYNSTGQSRGVPDLSANGADYVVAVASEFLLLSGTSASTPVVGAILSAVNDARLAVGKSPIGFINPTIYSAKFQDAFNDITNGSNPGCGTPGFSAQKGWDPVTGVGTPNFQKLIQYWLELS